MRKRLAQLGIELATGDDHSRDRIADVACDLVKEEGRGLEVNPRDGGQRPPLATLHRQRVGCGHGALDSHWGKRLAPGEVQMHRPRARLSASSGKCPARSRAVMQQAIVVGIVGADLTEPANRRAVDLQLVDGLAGTNPP